MQVVGNWLSSPRHGAPERGKLHHTHYCANIYGTEGGSRGLHVRCKYYKTSNLPSHQLWYLPLKFRLFILKFKGAKGLEDTIFPPAKKKPAHTQNESTRFLLIFCPCCTVDSVVPLADCSEIQPLPQLEAGIYRHIHHTGNTES